MENLIYKRADSGKIPVKKSSNEIKYALTKFQESLEILPLNLLIDQVFFPMALLPILHFPDPRLRLVATPVAIFDNALRQLVTDMAETMYAAPGIGLAATQVNVHHRVVVIDVSEEKNQLWVLINPEIETTSGSQKGEEGCLSVPGIYESVVRSEAVRVHFLDQTGKAQTLSADGLLAVCIQHEIDHLNGKVFVDHLSLLKQGRIKNKLAKQARITA